MAGVPGAAGGLALWTGSGARVDSDTYQGVPQVTQWGGVTCTCWQGLASTTKEANISRCQDSELHSSPRFSGSSLPKSSTENFLKMQIPRPSPVVLTQAMWVVWASCFWTLLKANSSTASLIGMPWSPWNDTSEILASGQTPSWMKRCEGHIITSDTPLSFSAVILK